MAWCRSGGWERRKADLDRRFWPTSCSTRRTRRLNAKAILGALRRRCERLRAQPEGGRTGDGAAQAALWQAAPDGQRDQERGGQRAWPQGPRLRLLGGGGGRDQAQSRRQAVGDVQATHPAADPPLRRTQPAGCAACRMRPTACGSYVLGWKASFRLAPTPGVWNDLDQWMRRRARAVQLKQWKRGKTMGELLALGARPDVDRRPATAAAGGATAACSSTRS
jgi:hypothetical protein